MTYDRSKISNSNIGKGGQSTRDQANPQEIYTVPAVRTLVFHNYHGAMIREILNVEAVILNRPLSNNQAKPSLDRVEKPELTFPSDAVIIVTTSPSHLWKKPRLTFSFTSDIDLAGFERPPFVKRGSMPQGHGGRFLNNI